MKLNTIIQGDCLDVLKTLPSESVNCVITSPPYWALRDYGTASWEGGSKDCNHQVGRNTRGGLTEKQLGNKGGWGDESVKNGENCPKCGAKRIDKQLGLEPTFQEYITRLCDIFDEVKKVLRKDGTCWVNMGDTYSGNKEGKTDNKVSEYLKNTSTNIRKKATITEKCLCQIPSRFAIEMTNRGWILRNKIIWHKPNVMPSSATDRFTVDFEEVFLFVKNKKYYFEQQFKPYAPSSDVRYRQALRAGKSYTTKEPYKSNTPYSGKYKRGTGSDASRGDDGDGLLVGGTDPRGRNMRTVWTIPTKPFKEAHFATYPEKLIEPMIHAGCPVGGVVLDPFIGSGTTAVVAKKQQKNYIGIELNPNYIKIANERLAQGVLF